MDQSVPYCLKKLLTCTVHKCEYTETGYVFIELLYDGESE